MGYADVVLEYLATTKLRITGGAGERDWDFRYNFAGRCRRIFGFRVMPLNVIAELVARHKLLRASRHRALVMVLGCKMGNQCNITLETRLA